MTYIKLFLKIIPYIIELVKAVESWMEGEPKTGEQKKATVMDAVRAVIDGWGAAVTGGAAETWAKMNGIISKTIDFAVGILFNWSK